MGKKAANGAKAQRSITSFFHGAPAETYELVKRKAPGDKKVAEAATSVAASAKRRKIEPPATKDAQTVEKEGLNVETRGLNDAQEGLNKEKQSEVTRKADGQWATNGTTKPGRRRLRQRVAEDEDEDEDSDVDGPLSDRVSKQKTDVMIDVAMSSPSTRVRICDEMVVATGVKAEKRTKQDEITETTTKNAVTVCSVEKEKDHEAEHDETHEVGSVDEAEKAEDKKDTIVSSKTRALTFAVKKASEIEEGSCADMKSLTNADEDGGETKAKSHDRRETPYFALAHLFTKIEEVSGRLVIQDLLTAFFRDVIRRAPDDLLACIYLCVCVDLAPPFENLKIGIGDAILMKAIGEATGANAKFIKEMYHKEGDLGKVAQNARSKQKTLSFASLTPATSRGSDLTVCYVYDQFVKIAKMTGNNSQQQKCSIIKGLLVKCEKEKKSQDKDGQSAESAKYIIRGLQGKLRIGLAEKSILMGLTYAFMTDKDYKDKEKQQEALCFVKRAFAECPSYNALVTAFHDVQKDVPSAPYLRVNDFAQVAKKCVLTPGTPVSPMLARPTKAYAMVFDRFEGKPFTCEYKYDGERAQIHILSDGKMAIFSRNFENSTERFPDVEVAVLRAAKKGVVQSCIVDAEVVAVDRATNKRLPFQILSTRSRKNVKMEDIKVPVCIYAFDLLYLNGESLLSAPLAKRREKMHEIFDVHPGTFEFATSFDVEDGVDAKDNPEAMEEAVNKVRDFLEEAVRENCEGLMVKTLEKEATYEPANRSHKWLKLKKDYLDGIGDSTDLVPIGAFHGRGKRTGVYGAYLLACYDPDTEMYQPITKLGTGLSDEVLKNFYDQLKERVVAKPPSDYVITDGCKPDVWFEASCVWEILGADLSISPKYTAAVGLVARDKGISLRFPRFIRIRDDKETIQATTSSQVADLYRAQGLTTASNNDEGEDDDMLI